MIAQQTFVKLLGIYMFIQKDQKIGKTSERDVKESQWKTSHVVHIDTS